ncbi:MAG: 16S rRNA (guanine(527)-N(7))-methyltransferase RsmG [Pyrinomonadaceae bacterium]|nr:16S rRNA (guanine(527)-N(7))-methyltransferase RsmG [Pyrinomonadaceae bacterium]
MTEITAQTDEFVRALDMHASRYDVELNALTKKALTDYYELLQAWNARLHLVAPCSPAEFATRHVLESLVMLPHLHENARVTDIGSGAGLPIIPCLIARPDIRATLIESSQKKTVFLREALRVTGRASSSQVIAQRFEQTPTPDADFITCRALDRFIASFSNIIEWTPPHATLLFFGGRALLAEIEKAKLAHTIIRIPESERRFLFIIRK